MYSCPICGKDSNRKGEPFEDKEPVVSHISGSHDPDHRNLSGEDMREEIEETAPEPEGVGSEPDETVEPPTPDAGGPLGDPEDSVSRSESEADMASEPEGTEEDTEAAEASEVAPDSEGEAPEGSKESLLLLAALGAFLFLFGDLDQLLDENEGSDPYGGRDVL